MWKSPYRKTFPFDESIGYFSFAAKLLFEKLSFNELAYEIKLFVLTVKLFLLLSDNNSSIISSSRSVNILTKPELLLILNLESLLGIPERVASLLTQSRMSFLSIPNLFEMEWIDIFKCTKFITFNLKSILYFLYPFLISFSNYPTNFVLLLSLNKILKLIKLNYVYFI